MGPALSARRLLLKVCTFIGVAVGAVVAVRLAWSAIGGGPLGFHGQIALSLGVAGTIGLTWP